MYDTLNPHIWAAEGKGPKPLDPKRENLSSRVGKGWRRKNEDAVNAALAEIFMKA
jgi:hypothetical protein